MCYVNIQKGFIWPNCYSEREEVDISFSVPLALPLFLSLPRTEGFETEILLIPALGMGAYCTVHTVHILNYFHSWASMLNVG